MGTVMGCRVMRSDSSLQALDIVCRQQLVFDDSTREPLAHQILETIRRQAGARLLENQVIGAEHGASCQRAARNDAPREQTAKRVGVASGRLLVERMGTHALDEAD